MVKIKEHQEKIDNIKAQAEKSRGQQRRQLMKCYHRLLKELHEANRNIKETMKCQN